MTDKELNAAMAQVMGWRRVVETWNPAENIAQAFEVAEKVGLFDDEDVHLCKMDGYWVTARLDWKWDIFIFYSEPFLTPALAICNAVLKREEQQ